MPFLSRLPLYPVLVACCLAVLVSCRSVSVPLPAEIPPPAPAVTREEAVAIARAYTSLTWRAEKRHALHGSDPDGQRVDTPDAAVASSRGKAFWWRAGEWNRSMPYKWGGFDTPRAFVRRLQEEAVVYAGDYASSAKIAGGDDAVSRYAAGIDCSGFVSRCWRLARPHSTRELGALCNELASAGELRPGDIMLCPGVHVVMFLAWEDAGKTRLHAVEAGGGIRWNCYTASYRVAWLLEHGYRPYRYRQLK